MEKIEFINGCSITTIDSQDSVRGKIRGFSELIYIRIDLSEFEIERIRNGGVVQTQYPWLSIGSKGNYNVE